MVNQNNKYTKNIYLLIFLKNDFYYFLKSNKNE